MSPDDVARQFTRADGSYAFARWGRPIVPVIFGIEEATLRVMKGAIEAVVSLAGHRMSDSDPELGANLMVFFCRDWDELAEVPHLEDLLPDPARVTARLKSARATEYRLFRYDGDGAIRACFVFLRMDDRMSALPAETLALGQSVLAMLTWSEAAFADRSALATTQGGAVVLRPEIAALIRAAYDPVMPPAATDPSHALRLAARMGTT